MTREIVTSENRDEYIAKKLNLSNEDEKKDELKDLSERYKKEHGVESDLWENKRGIELSRIVVPKEKRGEGVGSQFMNELVEKANKLKKRIVLSPSTDFGATSVDRLKSFYKKHGFVENKGKNKDYEISHSMYRNPDKD